MTGAELQQKRIFPGYLPGYVEAIPGKKSLDGRERIFPGYLPGYVEAGGALNWHMNCSGFFPAICRATLKRFVDHYLNPVKRIFPGYLPGYVEADLHELARNQATDFSRLFAGLR